MGCNLKVGCVANAVSLCGAPPAVCLCMNLCRWLCVCTGCSPWKMNAHAAFVEIGNNQGNRPVSAQIPFVLQRLHHKILALAQAMGYIAKAKSQVRQQQQQAATTLGNKHWVCNNSDTLCSTSVSCKNERLYSYINISLVAALNSLCNYRIKKIGFVSLPILMSYWRFLFTSILQGRSLNHFTSLRPRDTYRNPRDVQTKVTMITQDCVEVSNNRISQKNEIMLSITINVYSI